jgi:hypothetical protein
MDPRFCVRDGSGILFIFTAIENSFKNKKIQRTARPSCQINCSTAKGSLATRLRPKLKTI